MNQRSPNRFLPVAVLEHHMGACHELSSHEMADRLEALWEEVRKDALAGVITSDAQCIQALNAKIARAFQVDAGALRDPKGWSEFTEACGRLDDAPGQVLSWHFSNLYWHQLTQLKIATSWLYMNARRIQMSLPELDLRLDNLGQFLASLSASGPPVSDGQTFYPEDYGAAA
jgi:hypothetical protein